jgi:hypothetical protein
MRFALPPGNLRRQAFMLACRKMKIRMAADGLDPKREHRRRL